MRGLSRLCPILLVVIALLGTSGCAMFDALSLGNTWRMNRGPALDEGDAYFSVSDPAATVSHR